MAEAIPSKSCSGGPGNEQRLSKVDEAKLAIRHSATKFGWFLVSSKFLLVAGIVVSSAFIVEGGLCFTSCSVNIRNYVLSFYYIAFGLLSIAAELKFKIIAKYLRILFSYSGRGLWYLFLGTIALGGCV